MNRLNRPARAAFLAASLLAVFVGATPVAAASPPSLYLYVAEGFRYQDPNMYACTSTSAMDMLNFIALRKTGGSNFRWTVTRSGATRDSILTWERSHDTLAGGNGSDPHGLRNALNYYGWGNSALYTRGRVYDDVAYSTYDGAVKAAIRAMIAYHKPVATLAWAGRHVQMLVGYYGLRGDPFAKDSIGRYTNTFTVAGFYIADPLQSQKMVNVPISYATFRSSTNSKVRFQPYRQSDSPYDDPYTSGNRPSVNEWYGKFVIVTPIR